MLQGVDGKKKENPALDSKHYSFLKILDYPKSDQSNYCSLRGEGCGECCDKRKKERFISQRLTERALDKLTKRIERLYVSKTTK